MPIKVVRKWDASGELYHRASLWWTLGSFDALPPSFQRMGWVGAGDGIRTRDSLLGRQELYH